MEGKTSRSTGSFWQFFFGFLTTISQRQHFLSNNIFTFLDQYFIRNIFFLIIIFRWLDFFFWQRSDTLISVTLIKCVRPWRPGPVGAIYNPRSTLRRETLTTRNKICVFFMALRLNRGVQINEETLGELSFSVLTTKCFSIAHNSTHQ